MATLAIVVMSTACGTPAAADSARLPEPLTDTGTTGDDAAPVDTAPPATTSSSSRACYQDDAIAAAAGTRIYGGGQDQVGGSITGLGDFDGDGLADVLVGAVGSDAGGPGVGGAYLLRGSDLLGEPDAPPPELVPGDAPGDGFGFAVGDAGDLDQDGYADALVGALLHDGGSLDGGAAILLYGGPTGAAPRPRVALVGAAPGGQSGRSDGVGDVNGDGIPDVVVSDELGRELGGGVHLMSGADLVSGSSTISLDTAVASFLPEAPQDALNTIGGRGDMNGDGLAEILIGAAGWNLESGAVYLYEGSPDLTGDLAVADRGWRARWTGAPGDHAGHVVEIVPDVDGDGLDDALVGVPYTSDLGYKRGAAFVLAGFPSGDEPIASAAAIRIDGAGPEDRMGYGVAGGDIDGDGLSELVLGAKFEESSGTHAGTVYFVEGGMAPGAYAVDAAGLSAHALTAESAGDNLGTVATLGDVDGDGFGDIAAGARYFSTLRGAAYILGCRP